MVAIMNEHLNGWAQKNAFSAAIVLVIRAICVALGLAFMVIGLVTTPLPIPIGIPLILLGMILVAAASKTLHGIITGFLQRFPWLWRRVRFAFGERGPAE